MSKFVEMHDIKEALLDLSKDEWLEKNTTIKIINAIGDLPRTDIVQCKECKNREDCFRLVKLDEGSFGELTYCSEGEDAENE